MATREVSFQFVAESGSSGTAGSAGEARSELLSVVDEIIACVVSIMESAPHLAEDRMAHRGAYGVLREDVVEDDPGAASSRAPATPSAARGVLSRMLGKHVGEVLNYLALLAWNRCVMSLVGGPTRTTIDVLMTRQFHGLKLVWTWAYTLGVSSACVAVVRWSAEKRASLEDEEIEVSALDNVPRDATDADVSHDGEEATGAASVVALRALLRSPLSPPRLTRRFRAFAHGRLQGACAYAAMWAWAVASLGTLPARTVEQDVFATALLSLVFAFVAVFGAKGEGPFGGALRVTTERDLASRAEGVAAEDAARLTRENEASRVTRTSLRATCEWIVAVAWVGAARRFAGTALGIETTTEPGTVANVSTQLLQWFVAFVAVGARVAFVAARAAGQDEPWCAEFGRDAEEAVRAVKAAFVRAWPADDATRASRSKNETPLLASELGDPGESRTGNERAGEGDDDAGRLAREAIREKLLDSVSVARDASSMLAGAFAFTAGVALNAAAQTTWRSVVRRTTGSSGGFGAAPSATAYALALSAVTVAAATYAERCGSADEARRSSIVARALAADEARVGAFVAGFAWNAAFAASVGDDGTRGWPWIAAAGWTVAAAGYAATRESVREVKAALHTEKKRSARGVRARANAGE